MKKQLYALLVFLFSGLFSHGQITITQADMPVVGDGFISFYDTLGVTTQVIDGPGANKFWDYSNVFAVDSGQTVFFVAPATLPGASSFPTSNLAIDFSNSFATQNLFYQCSNNLLVDLGFYINNTNFTFTSRNTNIIFNLPLYYGYTSTFNERSVEIDVYTNTSIPLQKKIHTTTGNLTCDAWGTLTIPGSTCQVLRVKKVITAQSDSIFRDTTHTGNSFYLYSGTNPLPDSRTQYNYYTNHQGGYFNVCGIIAENSSGMIDFQKYQIQASGASTKNVKSNQRELVSYPNPASHNLNIINHNLQNQVARILDISGKTVLQFSVQGVNTAQINTEELTNGLYFIELYDADGIVTKSEKFLVQK